jgi:hypothetical protein
MGYESQLVFDDIRSRFAKVHELAEMKTDDTPAANDRWGEEDSLRALIRRVDNQKPFFDKVLALEPKFVAIFGRDKDTIFERLFTARQQVIATAELLIDECRIEPKPKNIECRNQRVKWRKQIFASPRVVDPEDEVGKLLQQFRGEIEELCRPIVESSFK